MFSKTLLWQIPCVILQCVRITEGFISNKTIPNMAALQGAMFTFERAESWPVSVDLLCKMLKNRQKSHPWARVGTQLDLRLRNVAGDETFSTAAPPCSPKLSYCSVRTRLCLCHVKAMSMVQVTECVNLVQWRLFGELQVVQLANPCNFLAPLHNPLWIGSCTPCHKLTHPSPR